MSAAIIGAIAVIVAAVFTGVASDIIERRKRQSAARAAALAMAAELDLLVSKLGSAVARGESSDPQAGAVNEPGWWIGDLPSNAWSSGFDALTAVAPRELIRAVANAYGQAESWQAERKRAGCSPPNTAAIAELKTDAGLVQKARDDLNLFATGSRWRKMVRWTPDKPGWRKAAGWIPAAVAISVLLVLLAVPRNDVNAQTVATAVETAYGARSVAECDHVADHWSCSISWLARPRAYCLSGTDSASAVTASTALSPALEEHHDCGIGAPKQVTVVDRGDRLLITPGARERSRNRREFTEPTTEHSWLWKAWRTFLGQSPNG